MVLVLAVVAVCVVAVCVVAAGVVAATVWLDVVDEDAPHALTSSVRRTAATGIRSCLMVFSLVVIKDARRVGLLPGSEHAMNRR